MDFLGATLLIAAVSCLLLALQWGGAIYPWGSSMVIGLFVGAGMLLTTFSLLQLYLGENSTIPPRIIRQRSVLMGSCYIFFLNMSNYIVSRLHATHKNSATCGWLIRIQDGFYLPFYFQAVQGRSATKSGIQFIPLAFPEVFALIVTAGLTSKLGFYVSILNQKLAEILEK